MRALLTGALAALIAFFASVPASAAPLDHVEREEGLWYVDRLHLDEIQEMGVTGEGVTIAVIDSGINTQAPELQDANITLKGRWCVDADTGEAPPVDTPNAAISGHGTSVVSMIVGNGVAGDGGLGARGVAPGAQVWFYGAEVLDPEIIEDCQVRQPEESDTDLKIRLTDDMKVEGGDEYVEDDVWEPSAMAALDAIRTGADIVSLSSGTGSVHAWYAVMAEAIREDVIIVGAVPNPGEPGIIESTDSDGETSFAFGGNMPATLNGAVAVNAVDFDAKTIRTEDDASDGSMNTAFAAPGVDMLLPARSADGPFVSSGTSFAAPMVAGMIALGMHNDPQASANQILQAMIRTTGNLGFDEPEWGSMEMGYGITNPKEMLAVDATKLPDENPLFVVDPSDPRCNKFGGNEPRSVAECDEWSFAPTPHDVWPDEYPRDGEEAADSESSSSSAEAEEGPSEVGNAAGENHEAGAALQLWVLIGSGIALVVIGTSVGMIVVNRRR